VNIATLALKTRTHIERGDLAVTAYRLIRPRRLRQSPAGGTEGTSARRINKLFAALPNAERYLEIGIEKGTTFENIQAADRWGVDPRPRFDLGHLPDRVHVAVATSDAFFDLNPSKSFDVVFLDGLHTFEQTYRDLLNAFKVCPNGPVLVDDVVPDSETSAIPNQKQSLQERARLGLKGMGWHGDVFRVILCVGKHHPELSFRTIVGSGNSQTLIWRTDPTVAVTSASEADLNAIMALSFTDVFARGIPKGFFPEAESEAIDDWAAQLAP